MILQDETNSKDIHLVKGIFQLSKNKSRFFHFDPCAQLF